MTYFLVYVSSASTLFTRADLDDILAVSRRNNTAADVSGALLYKGGSLMQVLEGEESAVRTLYDRIAADPRHRGLIVLLDGHQDTRQFADWSMAFRDLDSTTLDVPGYSDFLNHPTTSDPFGPDPGVAQKLLLSFRRSLERA